MASRKKRKWIWWLAPLLVAAVLFWPLPLRQSDLEFAIQASVHSLQNETSVFLDWKRQPFYDANLISNSSRKWHFRNNTAILVNATDFSMSPFPKQQHDNLGSDWFDHNILVEISMAPVGNATQDDGVLRFNVYHGWLAAQGYRVRIHRCLIGRFCWYNIEWVS